VDSILSSLTGWAQAEDGAAKDAGSAGLEGSIAQRVAEDGDAIACANALGDDSALEEETAIDGGEAKEPTQAASGGDGRDTQQ
jgi:hypothetical protein